SIRNIYYNCSFNSNINEYLYESSKEKGEKMISSAIGLFLPVVLALVGIIYLTIKENKKNKKSKNTKL
ncbi:hypothetical protein, partial [Aliarcobacter skirrowii]|uniref:hypothetical protein n=1 Tax=Aliarcobacter skirrowii TaxID=28200 RepID=UPI002A35E6F8